MNTLRRTSIFAGMLTMAVVASGCMTGTWSLADVEPMTARRDVEYHTLTLEKDGSFWAEAREEGGIRSTSGTYTYDDGVLDLRAHDGERHTYRARLVSASELELKKAWEGQEMELEYKKKSE